MSARVAAPADPAAEDAALRLVARLLARRIVPSTAAVPGVPHHRATGQGGGAGGSASGPDASLPGPLAETHAPSRSPSPVRPDAGGAA